MSNVSVFNIQMPLRRKYGSEPEAAWVTDHAYVRGGSSEDLFHSTVHPMPGSGVAVPVGVHRAVGGLHDAPTPGDMLCAALAACQDSSIRMVANILGIKLEFLEVEVSGDIDVRGTMAIDKDAPVGFQFMRCEVRLRAQEGTKPELLEKLRIASQRCCVVAQTLLNSPRLETTFDTSSQSSVGDTEILGGGMVA